uniref:BZIP domain-containing protein n=1 Tax=Globisporangium ultimum (strain ATCC 200006 / CBS 805.95 / DAOM BR144) TaxID=431595 RepID=K3XC39_GLOUD
MSATDACSELSSSSGDSGSSSVDAPLDDCMLVPGADLELVHELLASGAADAIVAERAAKALARKDRHRDNMIRYRRKKKATLSEMKYIEEALATRLQRLVTNHAVQSPSYSQLALATAAVAPRSAMDNFVGAVAEREQLQHENHALQQKLEVYHKLGEFLHEECENERENQLAVARAEKRRRGHLSGAGGVHGRWVNFLEGEDLFYYVPFTESECQEVASTTLRKVFASQAANLSGAFSASTHVVNFFGWASSLRFEWDEALQMTMIRFSFTKTFNNSTHSLDKLVGAHWKLAQSPEVNKGIYSVPVKTQTLQTFGDNISVVISNPPTPDQSAKFRMISIYARNKYRNPQARGCDIVTVTSVLPKHLEQPETALCHENKHKAAKPLVYAHGGYYHTIFMKGEGERDIGVEYGGRVTGINEETGRFLMVEIGSSLVRMESRLSPLRVIQSSDD